jgi:Mrp family chromosome partitioning ATPase
MKTLAQSLAETFDLLVFDSPPLDVFSDAAILGSFLDGTILVIDASKNHGRIVSRVRDALANANANVIGVVLNRVPEQAYSHYYENYGDFNRRDDAEARSPATESPNEALS